MTVTALITEYNPFHNGHAYHIQEARRLTGADYIIAVMSGNFVQRGEPAIFDKSLRTEAALRCGVDLVLELPVRFSTASAEFFASGSVSMLEQLGCVDYLCFGSESGNLSLFHQTVDFLNEEPESYQHSLRSFLKQGFSFPKAREAALTEHLSAPAQELSCFLRKPNNILGIEYLKALKHHKSSIQPITIPRIGNDYHDTSLTGSFSSATAIRSQIALSDHGPSFSLPAHAIPESVFSLFKNAPAAIFLNDFSWMLRYQLIMAKSWKDFSGFLDVSDDLARRIFASRLQFHDFESFVQTLATKNTTVPSVRRALLHILLQIQTKPGTHETPYARMLGFRRSAAPLLRQIKEKGHLPLLSKAADAPSIIHSLNQPHAEQFFSEDLRCSELYASVLGAKTGTETISEFSRPILVL